MAQDPLSQLRDIHLPEPGGFWPPAVGWWLLLAALLVLIVLLLFPVIQRYRRNHWRLTALRELAQLELSAQPDNSWFGQLNALLKRCACACYPERHPQALSGESWAALLAETWPGGAPPPMPAIEAMVVATWQPCPHCTPDAALAMARTWLKGQKC